MTLTLQQARMRDLINAINDNPTTFTWAGRDYNCIASRITLESPLVPGGFEERPVFEFVTTLLDEDADGDLVGRFADDQPPVDGETITIHGTEYRLNGIERDLWDENLEQYVVLKGTLWGASVE